MSASSEKPAPSAADESRERARRIRAMLQRWADEDVSDEPEWEVAEVTPMSFRDPAAGE